MESPKPAPTPPEPNPKPLPPHLQEQVEEFRKQEIPSLGLKGGLQGFKFNKGIRPEPVPAAPAVKTPQPDSDMHPSGTLLGRDLRRHARRLKRMERNNIRAIKRAENEVLTAEKMQIMHRMLQERRKIARRLGPAAILKHIEFYGASWLPRPYY